MPTWPTQANAKDFYGYPCGSDGEASSAWESAHLTYILPPWKLITSWDKQPLAKGFRIHKKCEDSLIKIFDSIWNAAGKNQATIENWGMQLCGGGYTFRLMRGSNKLSMHSYGCAVDFDPERNGYGDQSPNFSNIPQVLNAFSAENWVWGGNWAKPDGMHWQATII